MPSRSVPGTAFHNWRLKLAAVGLTVVLWALVRTDPSVRGDRITVPVRAQVADLGWTLAADPEPATVEVRLRGSAADLLRIARSGTSVRVPLDSVERADTTVELRRDWVALDPGSGVVVEDITPATVRLTLERTLSTLVPVRLLTTNALPDGMALAAPVGLSPQYVRVRGAAPRVRALDSIPLLPLDLRDVAQSGMYSVEVDTTGLGDLSVTPLTASIAIQIEPTVEREIAAVPVIAGSAPKLDSLLIEPAAVSVRLAGARTPVGSTDSSQVRAVVPADALAGLAPGEERRVPIRLRGVPALVRAYAAVDSVTVRRVPRAVRATGARSAGGAGS